MCNAMFAFVRQLSLMTSLYVRWLVFMFSFSSLCVTPNRYAVARFFFRARDPIRRELIEFGVNSAIEREENRKKW